MEQNKRPLLSICIPTYNRAEYLRDALQNITSDPAFDDRIEIIISDNASTDSTPQVANEYMSRFTNVKYFCNEKNLVDANLKLSLERASGRYLKLFNDTLRFKPNSLSSILNILSNTNDENPLFVQSINFLSDTDTIVDSKDKLISKLSFYITWIGNFGILKDKIFALNVKPRYIKYHLAQVAWLLKLVSTNKIKIYFGDWYTSIYPKNKGGYNLFKVFCTNYFKILRDFNISEKYIRDEKRILYRYFLSQYIVSFLILKKKEKFQTEEAWKIIWRYYGKKPYAYLYLVARTIQIAGNKIISYCKL